MECPPPAAISSMLNNVGSFALLSSSCLALKAECIDRPVAGLLLRVDKLLFGRLSLSCDYWRAVGALTTSKNAQKASRRAASVFLPMGCRTLLQGLVYVVSGSATENPLYSTYNRILEPYCTQDIHVFDGHRVFRRRASVSRTAVLRVSQM